MKAREITEAGKEALRSGRFQVVRVNYANPGAPPWGRTSACLAGGRLRLLHATWPSGKRPDVCCQIARTVCACMWPLLAGHPSLASLDFKHAGKGA